MGLQHPRCRRPFGQHSPRWWRQKLRLEAKDAPNQALISVRDIRSSFCDVSQRNSRSAELWTRCGSNSGSWFGGLTPRLEILKLQVEMWMELPLAVTQERRWGWDLTRRVLLSMFLRLW